MMTENTETEAMGNLLNNKNVLYVGERNAIIFSASAGEPAPPEDLPDDFFELNKNDLKKLIKESKEIREQLERRPFRTKAVREMEESAATLSRLNRYTRTVLRIQFPDRLVLQAVFNHSETVLKVKDFIRQFLDPSDVQFQLYTAPPKYILPEDMSLIDAKLTPRACIYFSPDSHQDRTTFLKITLMSSLTDPHLASEAALQFRRKEAKDTQADESHTASLVDKDMPSTSIADEDMPSTSSQNSQAHSSAKSSKASTVVPKWFKR